MTYPVAVKTAAVVVIAGFAVALACVTARAQDNDSDKDKDNDGEIGTVNLSVDAQVDASVHSGVEQLSREPESQQVPKQRKLQSVTFQPANQPSTTLFGFRHAPGSTLEDTKTDDTETPRAVSMPIGFVKRSSTSARFPAQTVPLHSAPDRKFSRTGELQPLASSRSRPAYHQSTAAPAPAATESTLFLASPGTRKLFDPFDPEQGSRLGADEFPKSNAFHSAYDSKDRERLKARRPGHPVKRSGDGLKKIVSAHMDKTQEP